MCGIAGVFTLRVPAGQDMQDVVRNMASQIKHRGPDDEGVWIAPDSGVALAHRRLSILDLSAAGHQPMESSCGRYVIVFNGEIYNHIKIRKELEDQSFITKKYKWSGHSDTETLLTAISAWGLEQTLQKSVGMFAIALWDRKERILFLARDRMGEKPLYYCLQDGVFLFASELKSLKVYPGFKPDVDRNSLALLLRHSQIPAPYTIYKGVHKLMPGTILKLSQSNIVKNNLPLPSSYWSLSEVAVEGQKKIFTGSDDEAKDQLESLLQRSISEQMISDVPLGAFLSGGIDSSIVVALMQSQINRPVKTFSIGFDESEYNEAKYARAVANHLGTEHTELYVSHEQAMAVIPRLHEIYDEPFSDSSQIPSLLVSELAQQQVTVSLSGDGGDELFGGYNRHIWISSLWRKMYWLPASVRAAIAGVITTMPPATWNKIFIGLNIFLPRNWRHKNPGDKLHKLAEVLAARSPEEIYEGLISHWKRPQDLVYGVDSSVTPLMQSFDSISEVSNLEHRMMYLDSIYYLPDDILVKVDRAAMGVSLETRIPFLDHRIVEFAWTLPLNMKIRNGQGKWLVRQVLERHVPCKLFERPKMGFGVPLDAWLRGPLKVWAEGLLDESRLAAEGFFNPAPIRNMWAEHLSGKRNWSYHLWDVLMFQAWFEKNNN
jgi:asparagine synthase (glutamine-hydrolysing)